MKHQDQTFDIRNRIGIKISGKSYPQEITILLLWAIQARQAGAPELDDVKIIDGAVLAEVDDLGVHFIAEHDRLNRAVLDIAHETGMTGAERKFLLDRFSTWVLVR